MLSSLTSPSLDDDHFGGIRLEDDVLITPDGCRLLGVKRLPITVKDVEREMRIQTNRV